MYHVYPVIHLVGAFVTAYAIALYVAPIFIKLAMRLQFLDIPDNHLKQHKDPTPYLGGAVIYTTFPLALYLFCSTTAFHPLFIGLTLLFLLGLLDDVLSLSAFQKFIGQGIATLCFVHEGIHHHVPFISYLSHPLLYALWLVVVVLWILTMINAFNLIDIMDGLAATVAAIITFGFLLMALFFGMYTLVVSLVVFLGALLGFLYYNKPPARIYLGDAGSLYIGGIIGIIPFLIPWGAFSWQAYSIPFLIAVIPLLEVHTLIVIRWFKGVPFYQGSPDHFAHYLKKRGWSTGKILMYCIAITMTMIIISGAYLYNYLSAISAFGLAVLVVLVWYVTLFKRVIWG